jgi:hypothetical protein
MPLLPSLLHTTPHHTQLYQRITAVGVHPSSSTLGQLVCVLAVRGLWDDALTILSAMCRYVCLIMGAVLREWAASSDGACACGARVVGPLTPPIYWHPPTHLT